jgi:hypothetical protein
VTFGSTLVVLSPPQFVARMFEYLKVNTPPDEALTQTRREMTSDRRYSHPVRWAAFVLYGSYSRAAVAMQGGQANAGLAHHGSNPDR